MLDVPGSGLVTINLRAAPLCTLWEITRTDNVVLRFTDHDEPVAFDGETYSPVGAFSATATQKPGGLKDRNRECLGAISSEAITHDHLLAGLYRDAPVREMVINWMQPDNGYIFMNVYWISETSFSGEEWRADVTGITGWLQKEVGHLYQRNKCRYKRLGAGGCGIDPDTFGVDGVVTTVTADRQAFTAAAIANPDHFFDGGQVFWQTGLNVGSPGVVRTQIGTAINLWLSQGLTIAVGDTFRIVPNCNLTPAQCAGKYDNLLNYGGYPFIPGSDRANSTPDVATANDKG